MTCWFVLLTTLQKNSFQSSRYAGVSVCLVSVSVLAVSVPFPLVSVCFWKVSVAGHLRTEMGLQKYEFFQRRIECVSNAVPPALFVGDASIASLQVSNQGSSRANALSGRRHVRLSMAAKAGEGVTVGPGPSSGSGPLTQAAKANNESCPKKKRRFMGAKVGNFSRFPHNGHKFMPAQTVPGSAGRSRRTGAGR